MKSDELKDFEEMQVWKDAQGLAVEVYSTFSGCKDYSFVDQIKRASVSVSNNIAEGFDRNSNVDFARFLDIAKGSCSEVRSMVLLADKLGYADSSTCYELRGRCLGISKQLAGFAKFLRETKR